MDRPFEDITRLDRLVHEPARLAVLTALSACKSAELLYLRRLTGLTKGNLSSHLAKLEEFGLVRIEKRFPAKVPTTTLAITRRGRAVIEAHWRRLEALRTAALHWQPAEES